MIKIYTQEEQGKQWLEQHSASLPVFACVLGFTETGLIPGISAAGATPADRQFTALADAEFLYNGPSRAAKYPLPPLHAGASPVLITRTVVEALSLPLYLFNAGLPQQPPIPAIDLGGKPANCLSQGNALDLPTVQNLLEQGLIWGEKLAALHPSSWFVLAECVVGGTTTALAVLTALGIPALGKVNSSHPTCNHNQKWAVVQAGLKAAGFLDFGAQQSEEVEGEGKSGRVGDFLDPTPLIDPLRLVAAVGDPMQVAIAGMAIAASRTNGVLLAGGTQMLAVYALMRAIAKEYSYSWRPERVVVGTTRWVAEDPSGDTVGLAQIIGSVPLLATNLSFANSRYEKLQAYERGYVKEGMGAGGSCIAAHLYGGWSQTRLLEAIEALLWRYSLVT